MSTSQYLPNSSTDVGQPSHRASGPLFAKRASAGLTSRQAATLHGRPDGSRRVSRPATASAIEERNKLSEPWLPSTSCTLTVAGADGLTVAEGNDDADVFPPHEAARSSSELLSSSLQLDGSHSPNKDVEYDWPSFLFAYQHGRWDANRTPRPPVSSPSPHPVSPAINSYNLHSSAGNSPKPSRPDLAPTLSVQTGQVGETSGHHNPRSSWSDLQAKSTSERRGKSAMMIAMPAPDQRFQNQVHTPRDFYETDNASSPYLLGSHRHSLSSVPDVRPSSASPSTPAPVDFLAASTATSNPQILTAAATMRLAASAGASVAPLALPSPERELTDPMQRALASAYKSRKKASPSIARSPSVNRRTGTWEGGRFGNNEPVLPTIKGSPRSEIPTSTSERQTSHGYFEAEFVTSQASQFENAVTSPHTSQSDTVPTSRNILPPANRGQTPMIFNEMASDTASIYSSQPSLDERLYSEFGYLQAPLPPDEPERLRALFQFNVLRTPKDPNFNRICHLVQLVFNVKSVKISLVDSDEVWFKADSGMPLTDLSRSASICGHAILQRGDDPLVVLDATEDWRFVNNPNVVRAPKLRFYAGAPLRTVAGYSIGALCIMDDCPHTEFGPRQRHILREFAAITMREMELWKDKIQLRIRDRIQTSMERFTRECLEVEQDIDARPPKELFHGSLMDKVYDRAARLVKQTLDVKGAFVLDVSHFDVIETADAEASVAVIVYDGLGDGRSRSHTLDAEANRSFQQFFARYPEGKISEGITPICLRPFMPTNIRHALIVPIYNIDKRPFAMLCAYNTLDTLKPQLEGHELSYLRAIGVIILSAVLKRRMLLADRAKSLFISNISHELRTPLHGILAAAELLSDTALDQHQTSFLQTVQACGTSLVETVNHVLDFTKLSGNSRGGGVDSAISRVKFDLLQLVEETVEGCWIGHNIKVSKGAEADIGSVYSPPSVGSMPDTPLLVNRVETVLDCQSRSQGWEINAEKGGIRRVLTNLVGNSLKFTSEGYVQIAIREVSPIDTTPSSFSRFELSVHDTGKGISKEFLKNQMFQPFSQENPTQTGTGLGLAIVNSIVRSEAINGAIDVWSTEGVGTEITIAFDAETYPQSSSKDFDATKDKLPTVSLIGFDAQKKGDQLLKESMMGYLQDWWDFPVLEPALMSVGDILVLNDSVALLEQLIERHETRQPVIVLTTSRGDHLVRSVTREYERLGGYCRTLPKPGGPSHLRKALKLCVNSMEFQHLPHFPTESIDERTSQVKDSMPHRSKTGFPTSASNHGVKTATMPRRRSDESGIAPPQRPSLNPRAMTFYPVVMPRIDASPQNMNDELPSVVEDFETLKIGDKGLLRKSASGPRSRSPGERVRVLVVEDNRVLRDLLVRWLKSKGYDFHEAVDGRQGVDAFATHGPFDVALVDVSMPVLDGIEATAEIRAIEADRNQHSDAVVPVRILALTGMSALEDKKRAFEAGVDGYLVKPVAFKSLDAVFRQMGVL